jgi:predicted O-methyltransferase YrrM
MYVGCRSRWRGRDAPLPPIGILCRNHVEPSAVKMRSRSFAGIRDLLLLQSSQPMWFLRSLALHLTDRRAMGMAQHKHNFIYTYHHDLHPLLPHIEVNVGGCPVVECLKAVIVARFCALLRPKKVLEIGTFLGGMTYHIARNTDDDCHIWTLDLPRERMASISTKMIETDVALASVPVSEVGKYWRGTPQSARITQLWGDSLNYDLSPLGSMDLIYIDGSHAEPWVEKDSENAFHLLAPSGAILWDDCLWHDVQRVLGKYAKRSRFIVLKMAAPRRTCSGTVNP